MKSAVYLFSVDIMPRAQRQVSYALCQLYLECLLTLFLLGLAREKRSAITVKQKAFIRQAVEIFPEATVEIAI